MAPLNFVYVEDDEMSRSIMHFIIEDDLHHRLFAFEDTVNIIQRIEDLPVSPDIIFLDIHIQPISGFEVLALLRQHPSYHNIPIIALTASVMNEEIAELKSAGFDGCLAKPLDYDTFPHQLERLLSGEYVWSI